MAPGASPGLALSGSRSRVLGLAISRVEVLLLFFEGDLIPHVGLPEGRSIVEGRVEEA